MLMTLKALISGSATMTRGFPPYLTFFASMSPKVRDTDSRPGNTRNGPRINCSWI